MFIKLPVALLEDEYGDVVWEHELINLEKVVRIHPGIYDEEIMEYRDMGEAVTIEFENKIERPFIISFEKITNMIRREAKEQEGTVVSRFSLLDLKE